MNQTLKNKMLARMEEVRGQVAERDELIEVIAIALLAGLAFPIRVIAGLAAAGGGADGTAGGQGKDHGQGQEGGKNTVQGVFHQFSISLQVEKFGRAV